MTDRVYPETANRNGFQKGVPKGAYYNNMEGQKPAQPPFQIRPPPSQSARQQYFNNEYDGRPRRRRCTCCRCLAWTCFALVLLIVLVGIAVLVFYLVVRPKAPKYNVEDVRLTSFSINATSLISGPFQLSATTAYSVQARNPNKHIGIYYDTINIDVQSEGTSIGKGSVSPFFQGHSNTTIISGELESQNLPLASTIGSALETAEKSGNIPLKVFVDVRVRIKLGSVKTPHFWVHVRCNVNVNPGVSSGSQILSKKCSVKG